ncbi:MAG: mechanosensitive ion channel, partial [Gammaproteobacteria bacterium]|nr:mechanosensitive ion channel [Gammaproteobacteria bacterium]
TPRLARCTLWVFLCLLGPLIPAHAAESLDPDVLPQAQATLERLEQQFTNAQSATDDDLKAFRREIAFVRSSALECIREAGPKIELLDDELAILQPQTPTAPQTKATPNTKQAQQPEAPVTPAIARQLQDLQNRKASLQGRTDTCRLMLLSSNDLDSTLDEYQRGLEARQLFTRGPTLVSVLRTNLDERKRWLDLADQLAKAATDWSASDPIRLVGIAIFGLLGLILGFILRRIGGLGLRRGITTGKVGETKVSAGLVQALMASAVSYAPVLLALGGISAYLTLVLRGNDELRIAVTISSSLLAYFALAAVVRALLAPCSPATPYLPVPANVALPLGRRVRVLILVALFRLLMLELHADGLLNDSMYAMARQIVGWVFVLNAIWIVWLLRRFEGWRDKWTLLVIICLALSSGALAGTIGYINLGALVIVGIAYTLLLLGITLVVSQFFTDLFDGLDEGRYGWQIAVRRSIGLEDKEYVPGLGWLRLFVNLSLWTSAALLLLRIWDAGQQIIDDIERFFTEGIQVAGLTIVPTQLLMALLVFSVSLPLTGWLKGRLNTKWLVETRIEPSAREALVTTFGYVGVAIAVIVALSIAGIRFSNLAIVAGALSVGVGFGLQNIVNNFVSGIIMLVERPVRNGDWIVVGETEGYVRHINIRTTTIETFDRAVVIVPNSDMISSQVTNWTLGNTLGRLKLPVSVAADSDIATVIKTLLDVGNGHPDSVRVDANQDPQMGYPCALFVDFGDSSLDFELRVIIRNINQRRRVISELNRAMNDALIKRGIEIPFNTLDVNMRTPLQIEGDSKVPPEASDEERISEP